MPFKGFLYDVFLCYSPKDRIIARELAKRFSKDGIRVWFDESNVAAGTVTTARAIDAVLKQSRILVLLVSENTFAEEWPILERQTALFRDPVESRRRFIPIRIDDVALPDLLRQFKYIDWRDRHDPEYQRLLSVCQATAEVEPTELRQLLGSHQSAAWAVAMTPDGQRVVSTSEDRVIKVWNTHTRAEVTAIADVCALPLSIAVTADGHLAISGHSDKLVRLWDLRRRELVYEFRGHSSSIQGVAITPDGRRAVSASRDRSLRVWNVDAKTCLGVLAGHSGDVVSVAITSDGHWAFSGSQDATVRIWDIEHLRCAGLLKGHRAGVNAVTMTPDGRVGISGSADSTISVWDLRKQCRLGSLDGHHGKVFSLAITSDGRRAVSGSDDRTVRLWDLASYKCSATFEGHTGAVFAVSVAADGSLAVSGSGDGALRLWQLGMLSLERADVYPLSRYTNAKVLLVGDNGVGKTGLALRLTSGQFEPTISSDAVWASHLRLPSEPGNATEATMEREIWLWDFAGQADYRLIHQLFMDETALAILVFNPQQEDPFEGLIQWGRALDAAGRQPFKKLLVAGRCDRGGLMVSHRNIEEFCRERQYTAYLETSALTGAGCEELRSAVVRNIDWKQLPWTASPKVFKFLKEGIIRSRDEGTVLLRMSELKQQLEIRDAGVDFTVEDLRAVVRLLAGPGIVWKLEFGDFVLLRPEKANAYAAAVIRSVRSHVDEIGCIFEQQVLDGDLEYRGMERLGRDEEGIVLRAMHQVFIQRGVCLRESAEGGPLLVFPSYFKRERPDLGGHPAPLVTYGLTGPLDEIYATLVVRLHYAKAFGADQLWRFAADFKTPEGKRAGLKLTKNAGEQGEIHIYFDNGVPDDTKVTFVRYVHEHLQSKCSSVVRIRHYTCSHCGTPVSNQKAVQDRLDRGLKDILCVNCERRIPLWDLVEQKFASEEMQERVRKLEEQAQSVIDNESRELILIGHAFAIAGQAGQIFRPTPNSDWGIDGEIEFKDYSGNASGQRIYLQLKSGDSYLSTRKTDGTQVFAIKNPRHAEYWQQQAYPVMLVVRTSDGAITWMDVSAYLREQQRSSQRPLRSIVFVGEPFNSASLRRMRDKAIPLSTQ